MKEEILQEAYGKMTVSRLRKGGELILRVDMVIDETAENAKSSREEKKDEE